MVSCVAYIFIVVFSENSDCCSGGNFLVAMGVLVWLYTMLLLFIMIMTFVGCDSVTSIGLFETISKSLLSSFLSPWVTISCSVCCACLLLMCCSVQTSQHIMPKVPWRVFFSLFHFSSRASFISCVSVFGSNDTEKDRVRR